MKNFARISISFVAILGLAGTAFAQGAGSAKAPTTAPAKPAPAPTPAPADKAPAGTESKAPVMAKPDAQIAAAAKAMAGTWKCTGMVMGGADMKTEVAMKATMKAKVDLDGWWIQGTFAETKKGGFKFTDYTTYDATSKKWTRIMVDNMGGQETSTSTGPTGTKTVWEGTASGMGMSMKSRHTEEMVSAKELKLVGEYSMDGKTYSKMYDMTCKK